MVTTWSTYSADPPKKVVSDTFHWKEQKLWAASLEISKNLFKKGH